MMRSKGKRGHVARLRQIGKELDVIHEELSQFEKFKEEMQKEGIWDR